MRDLKLWRRPASLGPLLEDMRGIMESLGRRAESVLAAPAPLASVEETDRSVIVSAKVSGFDKEDIEVTLSGQSLSIRGEKKSEASTRKHGIAGLVRRHGAFRHTVALPVPVRAAEAKAAFHDETLRVEIPKMRETETKKIEIQ